MLLIVSDNTDVYHNLAAEDYLLHHVEEDVLMLWRSHKAVVCGKHQNLCAEINYGYCKQNGIDIARRLTGGGTVFHDLGNINFSFLKTINQGLDYAINYRRFLDPIRAALQSMGVPTEYSSRNDLLLLGKKISGNAEHILQKKKRVLHHGTLLFKSHLHTLGQTLHSDGIYTDKAVRSVRSEVTNISDHYLENIQADNFLKKLSAYFDNEKHTNRYVFNSDEVNAIEKTRNEKYLSPAWIVGYSPNYTVNKTAVLDGKTISIDAEVKKGVIENLSIAGHPDFIEKIEVDRYIGKELSEPLAADFARAMNASNPEPFHYILF